MNDDITKSGVMFLHRFAVSCILTFLLGLLMLFPARHYSASAQAPTPTPTCTQPDDVDIAFAFCDAAHDDLAGDYAPPLKDVSTDGYIPPVILKAIGWYETQNSPIGGWAQCVDGNPYSSPSGCDWGIMQIYSGMNCDDPESQFNTETQQQVKYDYRYNIAMGAYILKKWKWDWHQQNGRIIGNGDPGIVEHWYYAVWAYYGWTVNNSPNNPVWDSCGWPDSWTNCAYVDRIWWRGRNPPSRGGRTLWSAVNLTRPDPSLFPRYEWQWASWNWHISDPLPVHRDWCRSYLPIVPRNYPQCAQTIQNGDFEAGSLDWTLGGGTIISTNTPHSGSYSAQLGGDNEVYGDTLYQTVTIPSTGPTGQPVVSARLSYYWYMTTFETSTFDHDDLYVRIRDAYGSTLREVERVTNLSNKDVWVFSSFDVSDFIGQTIQVYFKATTNLFDPTTFYIDDVSLYACEGG